MTSNILKQTAALYMAAGMDLIPVYPNEKRPVGKWRDNGPLTSDLLAKVLDKNCNLGLRLREDQLLLDVDVKNGAPGELSLARLKKDAPDFNRIQYTTRSPSEGYHFLMDLPIFIDGKDIPWHHPDYPGIDFMSVGRQVLIGGSIVDDKWYKPNPSLCFPSPVAPADLLDILTSMKIGRQRPIQRDSGQLQADGWGMLTPDELWDVLVQYDPVDFRAETPYHWFDMMCFSHFVTAGEGYDQFVEWSEADPFYADHEPLHRPRWRSLSDRKGQEAIITGHYLKRLSKQMGKPMPEGFEDQLRQHGAQTVFEQVKQSDENLYMRMVEDSTSTQTIYEIMKQMVVDEATATVVDLTMRAITRKHPGTTLAGLKRDYKRFLGEGEEEASKWQQNDLCHSFVKDAGGEEEIAYESGMFWVWDKGAGLYKPYTPRELSQKLKYYCEQKKAPVTASFLKAVRELVEVQVVRPPTFWDVQGRDHGQMFNMRNGELWITDEGVELEPHVPQSRRRSRLDIDYDPKCLGLPETWLRYLESAFDADALDLVSRQLAVGMAYSFTESVPWLKKAWFLHGPSDTGKSKLLELIQYIIGADRTSEISLHQLGQTFATSGLLGKMANVQSEVNASEKHDPTTVKALISGDPVNAQFKNRDAFKLTNKAVFWLAGNDIPKFAKGGSGLPNRFVIISYESAVRELDKRMVEKWKAEAQEIFHWALKVYLTEYRRDLCVSVLEEHIDMDDAADVLREGSMPHVDWINECLEFTGDPKHVVTTEDLLDSYGQWARQTGDWDVHVGSPDSMGRRMAAWLKDVPGKRALRSRTRIDGKQVRVWRGLRVKT